jgi:hypothetical protein
MRKPKGFRGRVIKCPKNKVESHLYPWDTKNLN